MVSREGYGALSGPFHMATRIRFGAFTCALKLVSKHFETGLTKPAPQVSLNHPMPLPFSGGSWKGLSSPKTLSSTYIAFLDWRKAFDKVNRRGLLSVMRCIGVPEEMYKAVEGMYQDARFVVNGCGATSAQNSSTSDVRQGCPLSPYLFIILTTAVMADSVGTSDDLLSHNIAFADDTNLISQSVQDVTRLLHSVESRAVEDGLEVAA